MGFWLASRQLGSETAILDRRANHQESKDYIVKNGIALDSSYGGDACLIFFCQGDYSHGCLYHLRRNFEMSSAVEACTSF